MPSLLKNIIQLKKTDFGKTWANPLWQVSPHRNAEINHNLEYDFYYIENQNLVLDLVIIIMTAVFAVRGITH